jgi:hypothetical protein
MLTAFERRGKHCSCLLQDDWLLELADQLAGGQAASQKLTKAGVGANNERKVVTHALEPYLHTKHMSGMVKVLIM